MAKALHSDDARLRFLESHASCAPATAMQACPDGAGATQNWPERSRAGGAATDSTHMRACCQSHNCRQYNLHTRTQQFFGTHSAHISTHTTHGHTHHS